jgi:hypothetical protein
VAWGAHDALVAHDLNLVPDLLSLAEQWQPLSRPRSDTSTPPELSPEQTEERDAMVAVLDALIQMKVPVPADTVRTVAPDFGNATAVLLSRMSPEDAGPLAFDFYRSPTEHGYGLQYVSAALLALHPVPGFAADLLANIRVHADVHVVLPGSKPGGVGVGWSCGAPLGESREDWPVVGQYALSKQKSEGAMLLVAGLDPIYATRKQSAQYLGDACAMSMGVSLGPVERFRLIAEMLDTPPEEIPWQIRPSTAIEFQSIQQFDNDLRAFIQEQQDMYRATVDALRDRDLLTPSEAEQCLPELTLQLIDERDAGATPIPKRSDLPPHVEWSSLPF